jgi:hypothetical protein
MRWAGRNQGLVIARNFGDLPTRRHAAVPRHASCYLIGPVDLFPIKANLE